MSSTPLARCAWRAEMEDAAATPAPLTLPGPAEVPEQARAQARALRRPIDVGPRGEWACPRFAMVIVGAMRRHKNL